MAACVKALSPLIFHLSSSNLEHGDIEGHRGGIKLISKKLILTANSNNKITLSAAIYIYI